MHTVIFMSQFEQSARDLRLSEDEIWRIVHTASKEPRSGELIKGTGGARKVRIARDNGGKRAGFRAVWYYGGEDVPIFLLDVYTKGERIDLSQTERNELKSILRAVADEYRASAARCVEELREKRRAS